MSDSYNEHQYARLVTTEALVQDLRERNAALQNRLDTANELVGFLRAQLDAARAFIERTN